MRRDLGRYLSLAVIVFGLVAMPLLADGGCCDQGSCCVTQCCNTDAAVPCNPCLDGGCGRSRSFFMPRPISDDTAYEYALHGYNAYHNKHHGRTYDCDTQPAAFTSQSTLFYQESNSEEELAQYFLKCKKCELSVREDGDGDLGSGWFGIPDTTANQAFENGQCFSSCITICPERKVYGGILKFRHELCCLAKGLWWSLLMPVVKVEHRMNLCERGVKNAPESCAADERSAGECVRSMTQAFDQRAWCYGKIQCEKMTKSGVEDLQFNIGWDFMRREKMHLGVRFDMLIPMGCTPTANFMFEPVLGNGGHFGVGFGLNYDYNFWSNENSSLTFLADFRHRYLFSSTERRSFDLKCNGDWSRYLLVAECGNPEVCCPGINYFTRDVSVTPRSSINLLGALHYQYKSFGLEFGYNFWWRQEEELCIEKDCCYNIGICDAAAVSGAVSASQALICNGTGPCARDNQVRNNAANGAAPASDSTFVKVRDCDLDMCSATHPSATSHKIYGAISLDTRILGCKNMVGFGASYEFGSKCKSADYWAVWGKLAGSF